MNSHVTKRQKLARQEQQSQGKDFQTWL